MQIAILTHEVKYLTKHLQQHKKDHSSRRGLLRKVSERRRLLRYLEREDKKRWDGLVDTLKLNKAVAAQPSRAPIILDEEEAV